MNRIVLAVSILVWLDSLYAGTIEMSASDWTKELLSSDKHHIVIKDSATVKFVATVDEPNVTVTYTKSSGVSQGQNQGAGSKTQTTIFSFSSNCVGVENWIEANIAHSATYTDENNIQRPCLKNGKKIRYYVYIPKLVFNTSSWSPGNSKLSNFASDWCNGSTPTIGALYLDTGGYESIPYEYDVTVASSGTSLGFLTPSNLGVNENASISIDTVNSQGQITPDPNPSTRADTYEFNDGTSYICAPSNGTANNPLIYAIDSPGCPKQSTEDLIPGLHCDAVIDRKVLKSQPLYKGKLVGKEATKTFRTKVTKDPNGGSPHWSQLAGN